MQKTSTSRFHFVQIEKLVSYLKSKLIKKIYLPRRHKDSKKN